MRKPSNLQPAPRGPRPSRTVAALIPPEDRPQGRAVAINSTGPTAIRVASPDVVLARRSTGRSQHQPATEGASKAATKVLAGSCPASCEFLEYEQGGGI
jgi:hypothetical protein